MTNEERKALLTEFTSAVLLAVPAQLAERVDVSMSVRLGKLDRYRIRLYTKKTPDRNRGVLEA